MATNRQSVPPLGTGGRPFLGALVAVLTLAMSGCVGTGLIYTRVTRPYSRNFQGTPAGTKTCRVNEHILREPFSGASMSLSFTTRVAEEAARTAGMTNIYYADLETLSVLRGIYEKKTLILCGD